jgi:hypothetical protein
MSNDKLWMLLWQGFHLLNQLAQNQEIITLYLVQLLQQQN